MKVLSLLSLAVLLVLSTSCRDKNHIEAKGFSISDNPTTEEDSEGVNENLESSQKLQTRPIEVLLTNDPNYRLITIYKVNYDKKRKSYFTGHNGHYYNYYRHSRRDGNNWNNHYMPGIDAVYGYNFLNIGLHQTDSGSQKDLFPDPVLIKSLYYPSFETDTLYGQAVSRNYYMVSAYDEDTNGDSLVNVKDLRRLYHFDMDGNTKTALIPSNYSVMSSDYDEANDRMIVFARLDENKNGTKEEDEKTHVFWIDLKDPLINGRLY